MGTGNRIDPVVAAVVVHLSARGRAGGEIIKLIRERFNVDLSPQQVSHYNPTNITGRNLAPHLKKLFYRERKLFYEEIKDWAPISQKAYRLQGYQDIYDNAGKNTPVKLTALKEARIESEGDRLTVQGTGKNGAIQVETRQIGTSQAAAVLATLLESATTEQAMIEGETIDAEWDELDVAEGD